MRKKKCNICKNYFIDDLEGRSNFYTTKYCSKECSSEAIRRSNKKKAEAQKKRLLKKQGELKELKGKVKRKCKNCKEEYLVYAGQIKARGSSYCSNDCKRQHGKKQKTLPQLKKQLWNVFSKYTRLRDAIKTTGNCDTVICITCGETKKTIEVDAGHFYSRTHASIFVDERNVHAQCKKCNMPPRSGEQYLYSLRIVEMYGQEELDRLTFLRGQSKKFSKPEVIELIDLYNIKLKELINEHGSAWRSI
jgi:hypothetical protein